MTSKFFPTAAQSDRRTELALRGEALYGDDFSTDEIASWFEDEREGYFDLYGSAEPVAETSSYQFAALAMEHGFSRLPDRDYLSILGIGSADGAELIPILAKTKSITILEPSDAYISTELGGKPLRYVKPVASGTIPFPNDSVDLIVCFHALHHIPNVSTVIREMFRVLKPDGYVLLREPTHSMGDWRYPRRGLTKRERGIPRQIFHKIIVDAGFDVRYEAMCTFSLLSHVPAFKGHHILGNKWGVKLDGMICRLPVWPRYYHATRSWQKIRPVCTAFVLRKP